MAAPNMHVNVAGAWKQVNKLHVKVGGSWKQVQNGYVRVSGTWKKFLAAVSPCSFSGALSDVGSGSTSHTGPARTITVPAGNTGVLIFDNTNEALGNMLYQINAAGFINVTEDLEITLAGGDTLTIRGTGLANGESVTANLIDKTTGQLIEPLSILRDD